MIVNFEGQQHTFPDDATDTEITAALGALPKAPRTTDAPMTAGGAYKAVDVGLQEGVAGLASLPRTVGTLGAQGIQGAANWVSRKLGLPEDTRDLEKQKGMVELPTYESALATIQDPKGMFKGQPYTPQNTGEEYLRTLGQFAPNVALGGGGVLRGVVAPALASETAGQLTKGYGAEPYARMAGGVLGATAAAGLANTVRTARGFRGVPALEDVGPAVDQGYTAARTAGVELNPTFVSQGLNDITRGLTSGPNARAPRLIQGTLGLIDDEARALAPAAAAAPGAMSRLTGVQPAAPAIRPAVDFNRLDALRRDLGEIARDFTNPTEQAAARIAQTRIDDLLEAAGNTRGAVLRGDANLLAQTAREARGNAAAEFRMRALEAVRQRAEDQAGAAHSGRNVENAYRQQLKAFVRPDNKGVSPAQKAGLTRAEITEIRQATRGTSFPNILRTFGNLLGGGGGIASGGLAATGYLSGDPRFYAAAGLGFGARNLSNSLMRSRANYLNRMVAARSPLAQQTGFRPPGPPIDATRPSLLSLIPNIPGRQAGGPVEENQPYLVGEAGPELFVPDQAPGWLQGAQYQTPAQELDPSERAARRLRQGVRPPLGREEGPATQFIEENFGLPKTPLQLGLKVATGPVGGVGTKIGALALGAALQGSEAEAAGTGPLWHGISKIKLPRPVAEMTATHMPTGKAIENVIDPAALQGGWLMPAVGDRSRAGSLLSMIGDTKLPTPVAMQGGAGYMPANAGTGAAWASTTPSVGSRLVNQARKLGAEGDPVYMPYTAMGERSVDFSHHISDALAESLKAKPPSSKAAAAFDAVMEGVEGWPGLKSANLKEFLASAPGDVRNKFAKAMDKTGMQALGLPSVAEARFAVTDPRLLDVPTGSSGQAIARLTGEKVASPAAAHRTYGTQIGGQYVGGLGQSVPKELMYPDMLAAYERMGYPPLQHDYLMRQGLTGAPTAQRATQKWVDDISRYLEANRQGR